MEVLVCHSSRLAVEIGRLHAEHRGVRVRVARRSKDVVPMARAQRPDLIVLGHDLNSPSTDDVKAALSSEPTLASINVVVVKAGLPEVAGLLKRFQVP